MHQPHAGCTTCVRPRQKYASAASWLYFTADSAVTEIRLGLEQNGKVKKIQYMHLPIFLCFLQSMYVFVCLFLRTNTFLSIKYVKFHLNSIYIYLYIYPSVNLCIEKGSDRSMEVLGNYDRPTDD